MSNYISRITKIIFNILHAHRLSMAISCGLTLIKVASSVTSPLLLLKALDAMNEDDTTHDGHDHQSILPWIAGYTACYIFPKIIAHLQAKILHPVAMDLSFKLTHEVMHTASYVFR